MVDTDCVELARQVVTETNKSVSKLAIAKDNRSWQSKQLDSESQTVHCEQRRGSYGRNPTNSMFISFAAPYMVNSKLVCMNRENGTWHIARSFSKKMSWTPKRFNPKKPVRATGVASYTCGQRRNSSLPDSDSTFIGYVANRCGRQKSDVAPKLPARAGDRSRYLHTFISDAC
jgi:hypothetical protein